MYLVRVLEGHKPPGCPVERGLPLHGKRRESVGAFPPFICGLEKMYSQRNVSLFQMVLFFSLDDIIIMHMNMNGPTNLTKPCDIFACWIKCVMGPIGLLNYTLYKFWVAVNHNEEKQHCFIARKLMCCHWILEILTSVWYNGILYPLYQ